MSERRMSGRTVRCDRCRKNFTECLSNPIDPEDLQSIGDSMIPALEKGWRVFINATTLKLHCFCRKCNPAESGVRWTEFVLENGEVIPVERLMVPSAAGNMFTKATVDENEYNPL